MRPGERAQRLQSGHAGEALERHTRHPAAVMRRNVEWKARLRDPDAALDAARAAGAEEEATLHQRDTYFHAVVGRLKLREQPPALAELIQYDRMDRAGPRTSAYRIVEVLDPEALRDALGAALGVRAVVEKERRLLLHAGTRIHLDAVAGLGTFAEVEAVVADGERLEDAQARAERWRALLRVTDEDLLPVSYVDLMERAVSRRGQTSGRSRR
jgi:adenylate cyclase class IV